MSAETERVDVGASSRPAEPAPPGAAWRSIALVALAALVVGAMAAYAVSDYRTEQYERARELLMRAADDDAIELQRWLDEGSTDAAVMATQSGVAERYLRWQKGTDPDFPQLLADRLTAERDIREYDCISMFTQSEWPFATSVGQRCSDAQFKCADFAAVVVDSDEPEFEDHFHNGVGAWCVAWSSPVRQTADGPVVGVIVYSVQVQDEVVAVLKDEPLPYDSSKVALVGPHEDGFDIIGSANGFEPVTVGRGEQLHVQLADDIVQQDSIIRAGQNEEGAAVMAAARRISGTDWFVASRVDIREVEEPVVRYAILLGSAAVLAVLAFTLGTIIVRRMQWERYREHLALVEIREALDARDTFMRNMSHELRTPLQSIMGFTSIMLAGLAGPVSEEQERQLGMVDASSKRLLALVDDVLDLDRMRDHGARIRATRFTSTEVATALIEAMRPLSEHKSLECRLVHEGEPIQLETDRDMVERIVLNLLSNAIKYTDAGFVQLGVLPDGPDHVVFEVSDSGRGIATDELDRVMDEFHQVLDPEGAKPVGIGLGLPISKRMAEALDGDLSVSSTLGSGSTFRLRIPRVHAGVHRD